jgi:hypothetical protein
LEVPLPGARLVWAMAVDYLLRKSPWPTMEAVTLEAQRVDSALFWGAWAALQRPEDVQGLVAAARVLERPRSVVAS